MSPSALGAAVGLLVALAVLLLPRRRGEEPDPRRREVGPSMLAASSGPASAGSGALTSAGSSALTSAGSSPLTSVEVAESADLLAVALAGGCGLLAALDVVASVVGGRAGHELRVVAAAVRWGVTPSEAWRLVSPGWRDVAAAFVVAERAGVPPSGLLAEAARAMRHAEAQAAGERAGVLSARLALPLGLTFLPGFVLTTIVPVVLGMASTLTR